MEKVPVTMVVTMVSQQSAQVKSEMRIFCGSLPCPKLLSLPL